MNKEKVKLGLIGLGEINQPHTQGYAEIKDKADIVAVCDLNQSIAKERAAGLKAKPYTDYLDLLNDPEVTTVDVTLPHNLHYEVAKAALEHNKHVIVEKPLTATSEESLQLIKLAKSRDLKFTVAENTRFIKAYVEAEKLIREGALGKPRLIRTLICGTEVQRLRDTSNWKGRIGGSRGGAIIDSGAHSFYLLKWLFGKFDTVQAFQHKFVEESEVEDNAVVAGSLENGTLFTTQYTFTAEIPWSERLEIYGSVGTLIIDMLSNPSAILYEGSQDFSGTALDSVPYDPVQWKEVSIAKGVKDFTEAVWEGRSPTVDPMDGYDALRVVERAYESIAASGALVNV